MNDKPEKPDDKKPAPKRAEDARAPETSAASENAADETTGASTTGETDEAGADPAAVFRDAAADLAKRLKSLPKAATSILPAPHKITTARKAAPNTTTTNEETKKPFAMEADKSAKPAADTQTPGPDASAPDTSGGEASAGPDSPPSSSDLPSAADPATQSQDVTEPVSDRPGPKLSAPERARKRRASAKRSTPRAARKKASAKKTKPFSAQTFGVVAMPLVSLGFIGVIAVLYAAFVVIAPRPPEGVDLWAVNRLPSVVILDRNGHEVAARGARYGEAVPVGELPPFLIKSFLATEDRRYYEHSGVDLRGIARAFVTNMRSGSVREGGSTITQQLAKNLFLSPEQSYIRKAKEALLALWLEGRYTKDEILSLYLNRIYLGAGAYGIESAAKTYFGKSARDVSIGEAAMLAGLPKAPSTLAPTLNPIGAQDRAFEVIDNLRETEEITEFEAREARLKPPVITGGGDNQDFGYFFDYVAARARALAGPDVIDLVVNTTIDQKLQRDAEAAVELILNVDAKLAGAGQAALIAYDMNGAVRAMVGGRSYVESQFNRSTQAKRQSGSAFKPFVYAAGFENGLEPKTRFTDQPVDVDGWQPTNYTDGFAGPMRLSEAMAKSVNTVAVQVTERVGRRKVVEMAHRLGVKSDLPVVPSIALGAANVSLDELTAAYLPFARGGQSAEPFAILKVEDGQGELIYQHTVKPSEQVISKEVAEDITHVLYQVMSAGTGRNAALGSRVAAGKTGTTNDWRDAWFIGYSAQLVAGVWVGNDDNQAMKKVTGGSTPARIWKEFMIAAHQDLPRRPLDGAYPAATYADEGLLLRFYADVSDNFERVRRDGNERRGARQR